MAQLIKLKDYISRYEWNAYRYPSQYIRMKQDQWRNLHEMWLEQRETIRVKALAEADEVEQQAKVSQFFSRIKSLLMRYQKTEETEETPSSLPENEQQLRQYFLDQLYPLQLKWASSTISDISFVDESFNNDDTLKFFLQRFPDIYLIMYYPIFELQNASVDGEIILVSPLEIEIISLLEKDQNDIIIASDERTWTVERNHEQRQMLSPLITLRRTEQIIKSILNKADVQFPIQKTVLSMKNDLIFSEEPYQTRLIGQHEFAKWFEQKRNISSPLKNAQLKSIDALLKYCISSSVRRPEWIEDYKSPFEEL